MTTLGTGIFPLTVACGQPLSLQKTGKSLYESVHCEGEKGDLSPNEPSFPRPWPSCQGCPIEGRN